MDQAIAGCLDRASDIMSQLPADFDFTGLSVPERLVLVERIWDSIVADHESLEVTQAQKDELDRRLRAIEQRPKQGSPWEEVLARLRAKK
jgi:putative addiction module component (TIGR02574 family)